MKNTRKLFAMTVAVVMILALTIPGFANEVTGTITINNAVVGQVYTVYQILDLESYSGNAYSYKATTAWSNFINSAAIKAVYVEVDSQGYVTWIEGKSAEEFAKLAQAYAKENDVTASATAVTADTTTVSFTNLDLGYYLVDTTLGTLCSLNTTNPTVEMYEKNEEPAIDKTVQEDSTGEYGDSNDAEIGQTVNFKTVITAYKGAQNYVLHDTMSAGLTLNQDSITIEGLTSTDYTVEFNTTDGCDFEIIFTQTYLDTVTGTSVDPTLITVTYSATVNSEAVIADAGNPNETYLEYGEGSATAKDETITYVWGMDVLKYGDSDKANKLSGAKFVLLNSSQTQVATIINGKLSSWTVITADMDLTPYVLITDTNGAISIDGLDAETYYLREIEAPAGYNKLSSDVEAVVKAGTVTNGTMTYEAYLAEINNQSGTELPSTGGIGTTLFIVFGSVLAIGAAVLLITKKRVADMM